MDFDSFHDYLENIQLGTISAELMQEDLYRNHDDLKSVRQMGRLLAKNELSFLYWQESYRFLTNYKN